MSNATKGLGLLLVVVAVALGGWWLLADHAPAPIVAHKGAGGGNAGGEGDFATPAPVDAATNEGLAAQRAADAAPAADAPVAAPGSTLPTADYLTGVVVDAQGQPVAGAEVRWGWPEFGVASRARAARDARGGRGGRGRRGGSRGPVINFGQLDGASVVANVVKSGADGTFRLPEVTRAEGLELRVDHPDYVVLTRNDLVLPSNGLDVGRLTLEAGGTVVGFVYGPGGAKQVGATVTLADAPDDDNGRGFFRFAFGDRGMRHAITDDEGRFRLHGMPPGKAVVEARAEGLCDATSSAIEVVARQVSGEVVLHLERGFELKGVVKDAAGAPVDGAEIQTIDRNDFARMIRLAGEPDAISDEQGRYAISGLKAGVYDVTASADGHARAEHPNIDPAQVATLDFTLGATIHVAGRVVVKGSSEAPSGVKVQLVPYFGDDNVQIPFIENEDSENVAKEEGRFQVDGIEPGDYQVIARAQGTTRGRSAPVKIDAGQSVDDLVVEVERGAIVEGRIVDPTGAPVANADVRAFEPTPPPTANNNELTFTTGVRIGGRGFRPGRMGFDGRRNAGRAKSDADGHYAIEHLGPAKYELEVSHADFATQRTEASEVAAGERKSGVDVRLGRGGTIEGSVVGIDGSPRASDRIHVQSKSVASVRLDAVCDANGYYRVDHVPPGEAVVSREAPEQAGRGGDFVFVMAGGAQEEEQGKSVVVEEEKTARVDFSQVEKPVLEGIVTCADGPVAGATVTASPNAGGGGNELRMLGGMFGGGNRKEAKTGADGRYRIADLDAGKWRVSVRHPQGLVPTTADVALEERGTARQDFALEGGVIEGVALEIGGKAGIDGAIVRLEPVASQDGAGAPGVMMGEMAISFSGGRSTRGRSMRFGGGDPGARVSSARDGSFRIPWVPAGKYKVSITHDGHLGASSEPFDVATNGHVAGVKVELPPAARLKVHVRSKQTGHPVEGSVLNLTLEPDEGREFGFTDGDGIASFNSLKPGTWSIQPREGGFRGRGSDDDAAPPPTTVTCVAGQLAEITIDV